MNLREQNRSRGRCATALLFAAALAGQDPGDRVAAALQQALGERLAADETSEVAWGAHLAAEHRAKDLVPQLRAALRRCGTDRPETRRFAFVALLDALVQTDAKVPFEEIAPAISELTLNPALLLAARDPSGAEPFLLERFRADEEKAPLARWMLCGNLLATQRSPGFASHLIGGLHYQVDVLVVDAATTGSPSRTGGGGGRSGGSIQVPANHPPTVCYELTLTPTPGAVVVATGRTPVFAVRKLSRAESLPLSSTSWTNGGRMEPRVHWLAAML